MSRQPVADPGFSKGGAGIEHRRRKDRGAVGVEGGGASSPENFWTFYLEIALFGAF